MASQSKASKTAEPSPADAVGPEATPEEAEKIEAAQEKEKATEDKKNVKGKASDDYDPYQDPDVPSSFIAGVIAVELKGGESPTLKACKEAAKENDDSDNE